MKYKTMAISLNLALVRFNEFSNIKATENNQNYYKEALCALIGSGIVSISNLGCS